MDIFIKKYGENVTVFLILLSFALCSTRHIRISGDCVTLVFLKCGENACQENQHLKS